VSQERPSERTRGKAGRSPARGITRGPATQPRRNARKSGFRAAAGRLIATVFSPRRPMVLLTLVVVVLAAAAAIVTGGAVPRAVAKTDTAASAITAHAGFGVSELHLAGNHRTTPDEIVAALGMKAGQSIFGVDLRAARARLMTLPWIADAEVQRRFPDDISVSVIERVPYARWQLESGPVLVEQSGRTITGDPAGKFAGLPLLLGDGAPQHAHGFLEDVARHRVIVKRVRAYQYVSGRRWNLILDNLIIVKLPETGWQVQLDKLDRLIVEDGVLEKDIREIDLRPTSPYFFVVRHDNGPGDKDKKTESGSAI
jgi:cell division protein FtsQ